MVAYSKLGGQDFLGILLRTGSVGSRRWKRIYVIRPKNHHLAVFKSSKGRTVDVGMQHQLKGLTVVCWNCCHGTELHSINRADDSRMVKARGWYVTIRVKAILITKMGSKARMWIWVPWSICGLTMWQWLMVHGFSKSEIEECWLGCTLVPDLWSKKPLWRMVSYLRSFPAQPW